MAVSIPGSATNRSLNKATIAAQLGISVEALRDARREGLLPPQVTYEVIEGLLLTEPDWLRRARSQATDGQRRRNHARLAQIAQAERRAEQARQLKPIQVADIARELGITRTAAADLAVVIKAQSGRDHVIDGDLDQFRLYSEPDMRDLLKKAKLEAAELRVATDEAKQRAREQRAREREQKARQKADEDRRTRELTALRSEFGIEPAYGRNFSEVRLTAAAAFLGLSQAQVRTLIAKKRLRATKRAISSSYGRKDRYFVDLESLIDAYTNQPDWLSEARKRATSTAQREASSYYEAQERLSHRELQRVQEQEQRALAVERTRAAHERARNRVQVALPRTRHRPRSVTIHTGLTNSGKTFAAVEALIAAGCGVYAAPLRFLAREAYQKLSARLGEENVGLRTGEERVNEDAPVICATAEMAPISGHMLVLDEAHWAADPDRGSAWSRLLVAGEYEHMHIISAPDALPLLTQAFPEARIAAHERLSPLRFVGKRKLSELEPGTAVVAFSRKAVLGLASELTRMRVPVAVLYGAMPVDARRQELERFATGQARVLCTTDVIGHGVNVPTLRTVVFAETHKFDGHERRHLAPWEIAQIAGRAGRFGLTNDGQVAVLSGSRFFEPEAHRVEKALLPTVDVGDGLKGHRYIDRGIFGPRLADLGCDRPEDLGIALHAWKELAARHLNVRWLKVDSCQPLLDWHQRIPRSALTELSVVDTWRLMHAPADPEKHNGLFQILVKHVLGYEPLYSVRDFVQAENLEHLSLEGLEALASELAVVRWFSYAFADCCPVTVEEAAVAEAQVAARVSELLNAKLRTGEIGRCTTCGSPCAPWFGQCDGCHRASRRHGRGFSIYDDCDE